MRRAASILIIFLLLLSVQVLPQQAPQQLPMTGAIEGTVVHSNTGEPVADAEVVLTVFGSNLLPPVSRPLTAPSAPPPPQNFQPALTGADGKFSFKGLNPGAYRLVATKDGFVRQIYGQRVIDGPGRAVFVTTGQTTRDASIRLTPTGTVHGRIYDENGQPATGAPVQLLRPVYNAQGKAFQSGGSAKADDRGEYRLYNVPPGRYFLLAGTPPGPARPRFSMVFYPNAGELDQASTIEVKAGAEVSFDMGVRKQPQTYRVRGRVVDSTGNGFPPSLNLALEFQSFTAGGAFSSGRNFDPATGAFELLNVPPGDYTVITEFPHDRQAPPAELRPFAAAPIHVIDADIDGVVLNLSSGATVPGRFLMEGQLLSVPPDFPQLRIVFSAAFRQLPGTPLPTALPAAADGTFQVQGLREGEYRMTLESRDRAGSTTGLYMKSIRYDGDDFLSKPFKFSGSGSGTLEVTLGRGVAQLTGNVTDSRSQPVSGIQVALIPAQRYRTELYRPVLTNHNGDFLFTGVVPGEYKLFSWEGLVNAVFDPDFMKQYEHHGTTVHIAESSNQNVNVRLIPAP